MIKGLLLALALLCVNTVEAAEHVDHDRTVQVMPYMPTYQLPYYPYPPRYSYRPQPRPHPVYPQPPRRHWQWNPWPSHNTPSPGRGQGKGPMYRYWYSPHGGWGFSIGPNWSPPNARPRY